MGTVARAAGGERARYMRWLAERKNLRFDDYSALWRWSVEHLEDFWASLWEFLDLRAFAPYSRVLDGRLVQRPHCAAAHRAATPR